MHSWDVQLSPLHSSPGSEKCERKWTNSGLARMDDGSAAMMNSYELDG